MVFGQNTAGVSGGLFGFASDSVDEAGTHSSAENDVADVKLGLGQSDEGNIVSVSVYSNRAEVSRAYKFSVAGGQHLVSIAGLPTSLEESSIRVEGHGNATIQDVTVSKKDLSNRKPKPVDVPKTSPKLEELQEKIEDLKLEAEGYKKTLTALDWFLEARTRQIGVIPDSATANSLAILPLVDEYNTAAKKYDGKVNEIQRQVKKLEAEIEEERKALEKAAEPAKPKVKVNRKRLGKVTVGLHAQDETEVELVVKYLVPGAGWDAVYDVRATTTSKENPVEIIYKAAIQQNTGEDWTDVPITLETATPNSFLGHSLPALSPWNLTIYKPAPRPPPPTIRAPVAFGASSFGAFGATQGLFGASQPSAQGGGLFGSGGGLFGAAQSSTAGGGLFGNRSTDAGGASRPEPLAPSKAEVTSQGSVNATFKVPGTITIPSDGIAHSVTIVTLKPSSKLTWMAVPSVDARAHLTARIKNDSEYTLLKGTASAYVDGSFISRTSMDLISPEESLTLALGLDPSIRLTHPPVVKKHSTSGLLTKTSLTSYTQRITIRNTKSVSIDDLKILARIPVSLDSQISVKLVEPALPLPAQADTSSAAGGKPPQVRVKEGVVAEWYPGANAGLGESSDGEKGVVWEDDESGVPVEHLGKDGKIQWACKVEAKTKAELTLRFEVGVPPSEVIHGL